MGKGAKGIITAGIAVIVLMGMFPPWTTVLRNKNGNFISESSEGYSLLTDPPELYQENRLKTVTIDWKRLSLQIAIALLATGGAVFVFGGKQGEGERRAAGGAMPQRVEGEAGQPSKNVAPKPKTHPWRRFFARQIDMTILYALVGIIAAIVIPAMNVAGGAHTNATAANEQPQRNVFDQFDEKDGVGFDVKGALAEGYSEAEIADYLAKSTGANVADARARGYSDAEIISAISERYPNARKESSGSVKPKSRGGMKEAPTKESGFDPNAPFVVVGNLTPVDHDPFAPKEPDSRIFLFVFAICFLPLAILPFVEGLLVSALNTPGKAIMGIRVQRADGSRPTYEEGFNRALRVILYGLGLGLPIISLVTAVISYRRLTTKGSTTWDEIGGLVVTR